MSDLDKLSGKAITKEIGGVPITLKPLTLKDMGLLMKAGADKQEDRIQGVMELVEATLKHSYPEEKDPLTKIPLAYMEEFFNFVLEVNGMKGENIPLPKNIEKPRESTQN